MNRLHLPSGPKEPGWIFAFWNDPTLLRSLYQAEAEYGPGNLEAISGDIQMDTGADLTHAQISSGLGSQRYLRYKRWMESNLSLWYLFDVIVFSHSYTVLTLLFYASLLSFLSSFIFSGIRFVCVVWSFGWSMVVWWTKMYVLKLSVKLILWGNGYSVSGTMGSLKYSFYARLTYNILILGPSIILYALFVYDTF